MKSLCLPFMLILSLLFSACGSREAEDKYLNFRNELAAKERICFCSEISCVYPDRSLEFSLCYDGNSEGCSVSLKEPEMLEGFSVSMNPDGTALNYEELTIETGSLDAYGLSPMSALPVLVNLMHKGYIESCWEEGDLSVYRLSLNEHLSADIWFSSYNMLPVKAEIISGNSVKVFCTIDNWLKIME